MPSPSGTLRGCPWRRLEVAVLAMLCGVGLLLTIGAMLVAAKVVRVRAGAATLATVASPVVPASDPPIQTTSTALEFEPSVPETAGWQDVKRLPERTSDELLGQVAEALMLRLDRSDKRAESNEMIRATAARADHADPTLELLDRRADLVGLPLRRGRERRLGGASARELAEASAELQSLGGDQVAARLKGGKAWLSVGRVPALMQVLTVAPDANRIDLADHLGRIEERAASVALAQMALYDPHPGVRRAAILSLKPRSPAEYRGQLLRGFDHPWPAVAEHAAAALTALGRAEAVPTLLSLLEAPDPQSPYGKRNGTTAYVQELVTIDHGNNCLMCHPVSVRASDEPRGVVPPRLDQPIPPPTPTPSPTANRGYYRSRSGNGPPPRADQSFDPNETFVRADVTYLKQDYSVMLPKSDKAGAAKRRFDLFVRERPATSADFTAAAARRQAGPTLQQRAAAFALRELTGQEPGPLAVNWHRFAMRQSSVSRQR